MLVMISCLTEADRDIGPPGLQRFLSILSNGLAKNGNIDKAQSAIVPKCQIYHNTAIVQIADGNIVEYWGHGDDVGMMCQLGAKP